MTKRTSVLPLAISLTMLKRIMTTSITVFALALTGCDLRIADMKQLNGCYESVGLPDFMRPRVHWVFRIENGVVADRSGRIIAKVTLGPTGPKSTKVLFYPGISLFENEHKEMMVREGDIRSAWAERQQSEVSMILQSDIQQPLIQTTSCS